jgi:hypothetical protein
MSQAAGWKPRQDEQRRISETELPIAALGSDVQGCTELGPDAGTLRERALRQIFKGEPGRPRRGADRADRIKSACQRPDAAAN